jgi:septal ring factor EnvC (AmiA/AmiB activator)
MSRTVCEHFVLLEEECKQCEFKHSESYLQMLEWELQSTKNMLNNSVNELDNAKAEIADLQRRLETIKNLYGSRV